jgi:hypothetical protein
MTKKIYKTSRGKTIDMGALILQNENVRAVGNMNINARGDILDSSDRVIDSKHNQIQRQNERQLRTESTPAPRTVHASTREARQAQVRPTPDVLETVLDTPAPVAQTSQPQGGLAAAIARSRETGTE